MTPSTPSFSTWHSASMSSMFDSPPTGFRSTYESPGWKRAQDVEKPTGQWNRQEVICDGDTITYIVNGKVVNYGYNSSHTGGKIQLQSEGAEIFFRRVEMRPIKKHVSHR